MKKLPQYAAIHLIGGLGQTKAGVCVGIDRSVIQASTRSWRAGTERPRGIKLLPGRR